MKFIFSLLVAVIVGSLSCSAADLDSVDYYELDPVYLSPMTASALDYGIALAAAADWSTTDSSNLASIKDSLTNYSSNISVAGMLYDIVDFVEYMPNMNTQLNHIASYLHGVSSNNLADDIYWIRRSVSDLSVDISAIYSTVDLNSSILNNFWNSWDYNVGFGYYPILPDGSVGDTIAAWGPYNIPSLLKTVSVSLLHDGYMPVIGERTLYSLVHQLQEVLASNDDRALANSQKANREEIENTFLTGSSGSTSLGVSDFGDLADVGGTIKDSLSLDGNATISSFTSGLTAADSAGQGWFSEETRSQLDSVSSTVTYSLRDPDPYNMAGWEDRYYWLLGDDE